MPTALSTVARNTAHKRLADAHPEQFSALLAEERVARGLPAVPVIGVGGRNTTPRVPAPTVLTVMGSRHIAPALGISPTVWRNWIRLGVPVDRQQDVADMLGLPVAVLWPQPEQPEQPEAKPNWIRLGVPVDRQQDVADMLGLPVAVLWPQPEQPEQPEAKPKRTRTVLDPEPFACTDCNGGFRTRADLARHRLHTGHGHDEGAA
jgi:lambda repressor-like predicted transcriptional regulator